MFRPVEQWDQAKLESYLDEWVLDVADRSEYVRRLGDDLDRLRAGSRFSQPVNYGF